MKTVIFFILCVFATLSLNAQLQVANSTTKILVITVAGVAKTVDPKTVASFQVQGQKALINIKFGDQEVSREYQVPRSGVIQINEADLNFSNSSPVFLQSSKSTTTVSTVTDPNFSRVAVTYAGQKRLKIVSQAGNGLEFDSLNFKNYIMLDKSKDVVIGVAIQDREGLFLYGEVKKRLNPTDTSFIIFDDEVKIMSGNKIKSRIQLQAKGFKIFFRGGSSEAISLADGDVSPKEEFPIGQFFLMMSYTDNEGRFQRSVLVPKHFTSEGRVFITQKDLLNAILLNW